MKHYARSTRLDGHCEKSLIAFNCSLKPDGLCSPQTMGINNSLLDLSLTVVWTQSCEHDRLIERQSWRRKYTGSKKVLFGSPWRALKKKNRKTIFIFRTHSNISKHCCSTRKVLQPNTFIYRTDVPGKTTWKCIQKLLRTKWATLPSSEFGIGWWEEIKNHDWKITR